MRSFAAKLNPPVSQAVYEGWATIKGAHQKGRKRFRATGTLHPALACFPGVPAAHQGTPLLQRGRPPAKDSLWFQLRAECPWATAKELKRMHKAKRSQASKVNARAVTVQYINVAALRKWLTDPKHKGQVMARKLLKLAEAAPGPDTKKCLKHVHWQRHGTGRMYADPFTSIASVDRPSRAVATLGFGLKDSDYDNIHPRCACALYRKSQSHRPRAVVDRELTHLLDYINRREIILSWLAEAQDTDRCAIKTQLVAILNGSMIYPAGWIVDHGASAVHAGPVREWLDAFRSCVQRVKAVCCAVSLDSNNERLYRLPEEFKSTDLPRYWSFMLQAEEVVALNALFAAATSMGSEVWSLQYDGLMFAPPSPDQLRGSAFTVQDHSECLIQVGEQVAEMLLGYPLRLKIKDLPLPALFAENIQLKKQLRAKDAEMKKQLRAKDAEIARLQAELTRMKG
jgi:hypothetical protein